MSLRDDSMHEDSSLVKEETGLGSCVYIKDPAECVETCIKEEADEGNAPIKGETDDGEPFVKEEMDVEDIVDNEDKRPELQDLYKIYVAEEFRKMERYMMPSNQGDSEGRLFDTNADNLPPIFQHLTNFYLASNTKGKVKCKICLKEISYSTQSNFNIKRHYQNLHHGELPSFLAALSGGSKRGRIENCESDTSPALGAKKRQTIDKAFKTKFDVRKALKLYYSFFIKEIIPYHVTDSVALQDFIQYLNPEFKVPSRRKIVKDISHLGNEAMVVISNHLENISYVSTTADSWSSHHRSFLGMTVHWIDPNSLKREKAVLGIKEIIVQEKAPYLAKAIMSLHQDFGLTKKVISTTTDNGKNYVAAFEMFAGNVGDEEVAQEHVQGGDALPTTIQVGDALDGEREEYDYVRRELPKHRRCGAHTVNLLAATDVSKVPGWNSGLRSPFTKTAGKAQALWNAQSRRTLVANQIKQAVGKKLQTPGVTRWNSYYESCAQLLDALEDPVKKDHLNVVIRQHSLSPFYEGDKNLLAQYCKIMKPVANCLDNLQDEVNAFMGSLLPNLRLMKDKVIALQTDAIIVEGQELIKYLLKNPTNPQVAFKGRFGHLFEDTELLMATALHPHFKLPVVRYLNEDLKEIIKRKIISEVLNKVTPRDDNDGAAQVPEEVEDNPFQYMSVDESQPHAPGQLEYDLKKEFDSWNKLKVKMTTPLSVDLFPQKYRESWVDIFLKYNTPIPSSAAVERLFSLGSDDLRPKRSSLTDENFEKLVFVKGNMHLLKDKWLFQSDDEEEEDDNKESKTNEVV